MNTPVQADRTSAPKRFLSVFVHRGSTHSELALIKYVRRVRPQWDITAVTAPQHVTAALEYINEWNLDRVAVYGMPVTRILGMHAHAIGCYLRPFARWPDPNPAYDYVLAWMQPFVPHARQLAGRVRRWPSDPVLMFMTEQNIRLPAEWLFRLLARGTYVRTDCVEAIGPEQRDVARLAGYNGPVEYGLLGYDPDLFWPAPAAGETVRTDLPPDAFVVGYVGQIEKSKGVFTLLEVFARLHATCTNVVLLVVGGGPDLWRFIEQVQHKGLGSRVILPGYVSHEDVLKYVNASDVIVVPSEIRLKSSYSPWLRIPWKEQFGRVVVEAMACARPVVVSDSGELPRLVGREDMIFQSERADELFRVLEGLHSDPQLRDEIGSHNLRRAVNWRLDRIAERICQNMEKYERLRKGFVA